MSYRYGTLECELVGIPELLPGYFITLTGLGDNLRNKFAEIIEKVRSTENLVTEINNAMTEQQGSSEQVLAALREVNDSTSQVQITSKEMASGIEHVVIAKDNLDIIAQDVANSMDEISSGVTEINNSAQDVSVMANTTSDNIQIMKSIIDTFKLE